MAVTTLAVGVAIRQAKEFAGAIAKANPQGAIYFVDSTNGLNGNDGQSALHPFATLTYALTKALAGDTIILVPGGGETVTATLAVAVADLKIICPALNPVRGYRITGAGTLDLMTISAAGVTVEGVAFAHTGATANQSCILTTAAADGLTVKGCTFDDSAIATTFTGVGVEITDAVNDLLVEGCTFLDQKFGVHFIIATGIVCLRPTVRACTFLIGKSAAFGVSTALSGTGAVRGIVVDSCRFLEANGDGSTATATWNGSNNTDATQGPIKFEAAVDQYLVVNNRAYTSLAQAFDTLNAVNAGAAGDFATNATGVGGDTSSAVDSVGTLVSSALSATVSYGVAGSTANSSGLSSTVSLGTANSTAHSSSLSAVVSYGVAGSTANSSSLSAIVSYGVAGSTANSSGLSSTVSLATSIATPLSSILSKVLTL